MESSAVGVSHRLPSALLSFIRCKAHNEVLEQLRLIYHAKLYKDALDSKYVRRRRFAVIAFEVAT